MATGPMLKILQTGCFIFYKNNNKWLVLLSLTTTIYLQLAIVPLL